MLDKYGSIEEEFYALLGFDNEEAEKPAPKVRARPVAPVKPAQEPDWSLFETQSTPTPVQAPPPAPPPAQPASEPDWSLFAPPSAPAVPAKQESQLPSWIDPNLLPPEDSDEPEFGEEEFAIPTFDLFEIPDEEPAKPEPIKETLPEQPKPVPASKSIYDFIDTLLSFEDVDKVFSDVANGIRGAENILSSETRRPKAVADALGYAIGAIDVLLSKPEIMGEHANDITQAANAVKKHYAEEAGAALPAKYQDRLGQQIIRQVQGPKKQPLHRLTGQLHGENAKYWRNRAVEILRLDEELNLTADQAEEQAKDEWNRIIEIVEELYPKADKEKKEDLQARFAQMILGGDSFENAEKFFREMVKKGVDENDTFYDDAKELETEEAIEICQTLMSDKNSILEEIEDLPQNYVNELTPLILEFGKLSAEFLKLGAHWKDRFDESRGDIEIPEGIQDTAQQLYNRAINLSTKISATPTQIKQMGFENGEIFKNVHGITEDFKNYTMVFGIETLEDRGMSAREIQEAGISQEAPGGVHDPSAPKKTHPAASRNPEVEQKARERYLNQLKYHGRIDDYYDKRKKYYQDVLKEDSYDIEKRRIRNNDRNQLNREINTWTEAAFQLVDPTKSRELAKKAIDIHLDANRRVWEKMMESWFDQKSLDDMQQERLNDRLRFMQGLKAKLEKLPRQVNFYIKEALQEHIENIPGYWQGAREVAEASNAEIKGRKFRPGEATEEARAKRLGISLDELKERENRNRTKTNPRRRIVQQAFNLSKIFYKAASL